MKNNYLNLEYYKYCKSSLFAFCNVKCFIFHIFYIKLYIHIEMLFIFTQQNNKLTLRLNISEVKYFLDSLS